MKAGESMRRNFAQILKDAKVDIKVEYQNFMECYMIAAFKYQTQTEYPFMMSSAHILLLFILEGHVFR